MSEKTSMILLDEGAGWDGESRVVAHWTNLNVPQPQVSIPQRTAEQAWEIRADYFAWVHDLGQTRVGRKTIVASLKLFDNLSYWWMSSIAVKSSFESQALYAIFKLRALEQLYCEMGCSGLVYCGNNRALNQTLQDWCEKLGHPYKHIRAGKERVPQRPGIRKWLRKFPYWVQAVTYLIKNWYLRYRYVDSIGPDEAEKLQQESGATLVTYFPNFDPEKARKGEFFSRYWEGLNPELSRLPFKINWVWLYFESPAFQFKEAVPLRDFCNRTHPAKNRYFLLEEFLTSRVFLKALNLYIKIYREGLRLKEAKKAFHFPGSKLNFFPIMEKEWKASLFGNLAMDGAIKISVFDFMAKILPASPWGLFTWENLSWDFALMAAWRRHRGETRILASQHGFFRPFDLRLCSDSRDFNQTGAEAIPLPDKLCVNNMEGMSLLQEAGYPMERVARVEAIRYFNLRGRYHIYKKKMPATGRILLVIMGITDRENQFQFQLLKEAAAAGSLQNYRRILIKPHPGLSPDGLKPAYESNIEFTIKDQPLSELWPDVDVVCGAHSTGASWEASWYGIPAIAIGAMNSLNLNPLAGLPGVRFVTTGPELSERLKNPQLVTIPQDYFFLSEDLKLWKDLLQ